MSTVKKRCQNADCSRAAATLCFCCNKNVCTKHFIEHIEVVREQIHPLVHDVSTMVENISRFDLKQHEEVSLSKLQQWKIDMHKLINEIVVEKSLEIKMMYETYEVTFQELQKQQLSTVLKIQDDIKKLIKDEDATMEQIQSFKIQLQRLHKDVVTFQTGCLVVNTTVLGQGLVQVLSNIKKPASIVKKPVPPSSPQPNSARSSSVSQAQPPLNLNTIPSSDQSAHSKMPANV